MPHLIKRATPPAPSGDHSPCARQQVTNHLPAAELLARADGILRRSDAISPRDEDILFRALEHCAVLGERGVRWKSDGVRSVEGIDAFRRSVVARLVERNIPLVYEMRRRCPMAGVDQDEMLSEGFWTLYRAVNGFDVCRGLRFSTYACRSILYSFLSLAKKRRREREVLERLMKERPAVTHPSDLDIGIDGPMLMDKVNAALFDKSAGFTDIECFVIEQRFLAASRDGPPTLESIGRSFQLSKERIRQIQCGAIAKLRAALDDPSVRSGDPRQTRVRGYTSMGARGRSALIQSARRTA